VVDLLRALDFWWVVREVLVDLEIKVEATTLVHTLVRVDCELEVQDIVGVGKCVFIVVPRDSSSRSVSMLALKFYVTSLTSCTFLCTKLSRSDLLLFACSCSCSLILLLLFLLFKWSASDLCRKTTRLHVKVSQTYHRPYFHHLGGIV
jgi:hypothetical protein